MRARGRRRMRIFGAKVTFIREGERAEFEVEVGEFGLDAEPDA